MTNVHAFIHRVTPTELADPAVPRVELCIHGGGEKYARGLTVADDSLPAVQRLKQMLAECCGDDDRSDDDNSDSSNNAYVTADSENVASQLVISDDADNVPSGAPAVDVVDVRELSSGCLKRSSRGRESAAKKQKIDADDASKRTNAESSSDTEEDSSDRPVVSSDRADAGCDERGGGNEVAVVNRSSAADGSQSAESSAADSGGDRCLLNTSTGKLQL